MYGSATAVKRDVMSPSEKCNVSFISPKVFYGLSFIYGTKVVEDPNGNLKRGDKSYSTRKVVTSINFCECADEESAIAKLKVKYSWWCNLHPTHSYLPFWSCVRHHEPLCTREFPDMHAVSLVMIPQD